MSIVNNTLLDDGPTLIIEPTKPKEEMTGCPFLMPSIRPPLITIVFAKVPPDIFNTLPVKIILFWLILKFNNFFNSIISLSELPNFVSIILSLRFSFLSLIFSFLRKAAD